jgi:hypothetical protein
VPVQSVFRSGGENVAFVRTSSGNEERKVQVGRYNDRWVQILEGLKEGEIVLLAAPKGFTPQPEPQSTTPVVPDGIAPPLANGGLPPGGDGARPGPNMPATAQQGDGAADQRPGGGEGTPQNAEDWRKRLESMSPEEREKMREEFRKRMGQNGGAPSGPGGGNRGERGGRSGGGDGDRSASESKSDG